MCNIILPERKSPIGTSSSLSPSKPHVVLNFLDSSVLPCLRESAAAIIGINEGLCSCIYKGMFLNNNKQLIRRMKVLQNTIICKETICTNRSPSGRLKLAVPYVYPDYATYALATFAKNVWAGKHLDIYIFPSAEFCTSRVDYLDTYIVNLDSDDNFMVFYNVIYLYIYNVYRSWASCNWATYPEAILVNIYTLVYFSSKMIVLIIKSHDKYQSLILIGLVRAEKASSRNRSVSVHYRSHWRGWRPLVTPWACCIKEGIEPWKSQKRFFPSHVQVSVSLCSLLLLLFCFCFCCSYYYYHYYYYYVYLLAMGFIITVDKETNLVLIIAMVKNTNLDILIAKLRPSLILSLLSLFSNGHCMCSGYLTHTISPAGLVALYVFRLSNPYNINSFASHFFSLLFLFSNGHCMCSGYLTHTMSPAGLVALYVFRLSNPYNINSFASHFCSLLSLFSNGHCMCSGYLTHTILPAGLVAYVFRLSNPYNINSFASHFYSLLSLFSNGHCMCSGYLTHTILPAGLVALYVFRLSNPYNINSFASHFYSLLSLFSNGHCMCSGYLTHTISPDGLVALYVFRLSNPYNINSFASHFCSLLSPLFSDDHGIIIPNFVGCCGGKVLLVGIHY